MSHTLLAQVQYSFKGKVISCQASFPVERVIKSLLHNEEEYLYRIIAQVNQLDTYSYEFEAMCAQDLSFSSDTLSDFIQDGVFDIQAYQRAEIQLFDMQLLSMAQQHIQHPHVLNDPQLLNALKAAYQAGVEQGKRT